MSLDPPQRKKVQHFNIEGHAHLLTFSCFKRRPLLTDDSRRNLLSLSVNRATTLHRIQLIAFVYMPEHIHLLVWPTTPAGTIDKFLYALKKPYSDRVKRQLAEGNDPLLEQLTIMERPGKMSFRFWQEGPGHDRNFFSVQACVKAAEYLHNNPVRRGLCDSPDLWRWSSWKHYHQPGVEDPALPRVDGFPP